MFTFEIYKVTLFLRRSFLRLKHDISGSFTALLIFSHCSLSPVNPSMYDARLELWCVTKKTVKLPETSHFVNVLTSEKACLYYIIIYNIII